jgi:ribosome biogenesis GTPase / thiamine phosphate phosphatase
MKSRRKKPKHVREHDWAGKHEFAFTHDLARHRKAQGLAPEPGPDVNIWPENTQPNGTVISHSGQWAFVQADGKEHLCLIHEALGEKASTVLAPGDEVLLSFDAEQPIVHAIAPRRTRLSRLAHVCSDVAEQVIAANLDVLVIVASAVKPRFKPGLVDRYMIVAQVGGIEPLLVINKMDLVEKEPEEVDLYRGLGLTVIQTSCVTGLGLESLCTCLAGKLSVLAGHSGVGKSSLLNTIDPSLELRTGEVSESNEKGRHTTALSRLHCLESGARIIDTPGVRNLGVWNVEPDEVALYFPEMAERAGQCRFHNCTHIHEPDCAIRTAVDGGDITSLRYESYKRIRASLATD